MAVKRFRKYGKKRRGLRRRTTRRVNRVYRTLRPRNHHFFTRYGFSKSITLGMDANGQRFGSVYSMGFQSLYWNPTGGQIDMANYSEFSALFDQYKVHSYTFEIIPRFDNANILLSTANTVADFLPTIYWFFDTDDATVPSDSTEVMQRPHLRRALLKKPISITVKYPCVAASMYNTAITTGYSSKRSPWIDINSPAVPHYGLKLFIQGRANTEYVVDVRCKWRVSFKNPR